MNFFSLIGVEFKKLRRSKILFIFIAPVVLIWGMAVMNADANFKVNPMGISPENNYFIQSFLGFAWFMLPASLVVITVLIIQTERADNGFCKMLSLPVGKTELCLAKYCVAVILMAIEILLMCVSYFPFAYLASAKFQYDFVLAAPYVFKVCALLFAVSVPMAAVYWMISVLLKKPVASVGVGLASVVPVVLAINTKVWYVYPMCYPMMLIASEMDKFATGTETAAMAPVPWIPVAVVMGAAAVLIACLRFGNYEKN